MIKLTDFTGGYNDSSFTLNVPDNSFCKFNNVDALANGGFKVRNGTKKINNTAFPGEVTQIIEWKLKDGSTKTIVISEKKMYVLNSVLGTYKTVKYSGNDLELKSNTVSYCFFKDFFYFTDGTKMYKWSDTVFYLHNLSCCFPYSFNSGDIIKLTVSKHESIFRNGESKCIIDIRNKISKKIRYCDWQEHVRDKPDIGFEYKTYNDVKCKYINVPDENLFSENYNVSNGIYVLRIDYINKKSDVLGYVTSYSSDYSYFNYYNRNSKVSQQIPCFYDDFNNIDGLPYGFSDYNDHFPPNYSRLYLRRWTGYSNEIDEYRMYPEFECVGIVDEYYIFNGDTDNFYPHNYNYNTNHQYYESPITEASTLLTKVTDTSSFEFNIIEVSDIPPCIISCKYFCYHPQSFRFFASGNEFDPSAVYYSELNDFETWTPHDETEGGSLDDVITNVFYPRYNYGSVTGLIAVDNYVLMCFYNGFATVSGALPEEYIFFNLSVPFGVSSPESLCLVPNGIVFYNNNYIYYMSNALLGNDYVKVPSQYEFICLSKNKTDNILLGSLNHKSVYYNNKYYLYFIDSKSIEHILVYNFDFQSFSLYNDITLNCFLLKDNLLLYCASGKYVLSMFENDCYTDFHDELNQTVNFCVESKFYDFVGNYGRNILNKLLVTNNALDVSSYSKEQFPNIFISLKNDFSSDEIEASADGSSLWQKSISSVPWVSNKEYSTSIYSLNMAFSRLGFSIYNNEKSYLNIPFCFYSVSFDFSSGMNKMSTFYNDKEKISTNLNYERRR